MMSHRLCRIGLPKWGTDAPVLSSPNAASHNGSVFDAMVLTGLSARFDPPWFERLSKLDI
jgi:hypothetical protein